MKMKVSDYIVKFLAAQGVTHVFELAGGMLAHLLDSFATQSCSAERAIRLISCHHEQGAGFAAEGMARMTGVPGVALATSGPGATNLLTAVGSAYFDSTPMVFITGSVPRNEMKWDRPIRQLGFQETDIVRMAQPITKHAAQVLHAEDVPFVLYDAFTVALQGRPGPVLLDIPLDVQAEMIEVEEPKPVLVSLADVQVDARDVARAVEALEQAVRPLVLVGGGVQTSQAPTTARLALEMLNVPVVNSLMGTDVLGHDHPLRVGLIGSYGNRWANHALATCDCLLVLGSRLDIRQTGTDVEGFGARKIFHVDIDPGEVNNRVKGVTPVYGDLESFFRQVIHSTRQTGENTVMGARRAAWAAHIASLRAKWPSTKEIQPKGLNPNYFMERLGECAPDDCTFVLDVGLHQMWAAQSLKFRTGQRVLTSGGMGAMGFALPTAIGAAFASRGPVVVIAGDGGFQLNIQELETIKHHDLDIKIVVLNNRSHGMVRQFQDSYFAGRRQSTVTGYSTPNFVEIARAYGLQAEINTDDHFDTNETEKDLNFLYGAGPRLLEMTVDPEANVYPKLAYGKPLTEMEPQVKGEGMEAT